MTARLGGHDDGAIPSIRGGIEVALPIEDLVREAFAAFAEKRKPDFSKLSG